MPRLGFDFRTPRRSLFGWRAGIAVLGLAALTIVGLRAHTVSQQREAVRWHLEELGLHPAPAQPVLAPEEQAAIAELAAVRSRMAASWQPVFAALERATPPKISLLSVDCSGMPGTLQLTAEARTLADALDYVAHLNQAPSLAQALLQHYEVKQDDPEHPVSFQVKAETLP